MSESSDPDSSRRGPAPGGISLPSSLAPCEIFLENPNRYAEVDTAALHLWLRDVVAELAADAGSLAIRFVGDRAMRQLNLQYRGLDKTTDVLSFEGDLPPKGTFGKKPAATQAGPRDLPAAFVPPAGDHLGDIVISVPKARKQAAELGHGVDVELRILLLHGILHCLGYDHEVDDGTMERVEAEYRRRFVGEVSFIEGSAS